jgi:hypothetical protein
MEDLIERYIGDTDLFDKVVDFIEARLIDKHPKFKVGQTISFMSGYNDDINYVTKIIGFDDDKNIYVYWDCYWFPIKDNSIKNIEILTDAELLKRKLKHENDMRDIKLTYDALNDLSEIYE